MAINHDDRVSTARLAEFWQAAKDWITGLISDEIDASETAMSATVDTKIAAAKPNYNLPNENNQIGVGYGWNESYVSCIKVSSTITYTNIFNAIVTGTSQWRYNVDYDNPDMPTSAILSAFEKNTMVGARKHILLNLAVGKLVVLPNEMSSIAETLIANNRQITETERAFVKSHFDSLGYFESDIMSYDGHTYQTRLDASASNNNNYNFSVKTDNGNYTSVTPSSSNPVYILAITQKPNALFNYDFGAVANKSVGYNQLNNDIKGRFLGIEGHANQWGGSSEAQGIAVRLMVTEHSSANLDYTICGLTVTGLIDKLFDATTYPDRALEVDNTDGFFIKKITYAGNQSYSGTIGTGTNNGNNRYLYGFIYLDNGSSLRKYDVRLERKTFNGNQGLYVKVYDNAFFNALSETSTNMHMTFPVQYCGYFGTSW